MPTEVRKDTDRKEVKKPSLIDRLKNMRTSLKNIFGDGDDDGRGTCGFDEHAGKRKYPNRRTI